MALTCVYTTVNGMLLHENRGGVETEYIPDPLGNLIQCRNSSGVKTYEATYWPYGEIRTETGTNPSPWGFVGLLGYLRDMANLLYVRARYYRPNLGRWQTVDPLWPKEPAYAYAKLRPSLFTDSTGLGPCVSRLLKSLGIDLRDINPDKWYEFIACVEKCKTPACIVKCGLKSGLLFDIAALDAYACCLNNAVDKWSDPCDKGPKFDQRRCCSSKYCACVLRMFRDRAGGPTPDKICVPAILCEMETRAEQGCETWELIEP